jgi:hypothetical protein
MLTLLRWSTLLACGGLRLGCTPDPPAPLTPAGYERASSEYAVLAQKALAYQADFDTLAWAELLAERVTWQTPDAAPARLARHRLVGAWNGWRQAHGVRRLHLHGFTNLALLAYQPLALSGRRGVHVLTYCTATAELTDGRRAARRLSLCCHFDAAKRIDGLWLYSAPPTPEARGFPDQPGVP